MRIERRPLRHDVRDALLQLIMAGRLRPGGAINELDIAEQLGVSRTPLREALMLLEHEGVVEQEPRRGFRMRETTPREVVETYALIGTLEAAALRESADATDAAKVERLRAALERMARARTGRKVQSADESFHRELTAGCENERLHVLLRSLKDDIRRYEAIALADEDVIDVSVAQHEAIVEALERGDVAAAAQAVEFNWRSGAARLAAALSDEEHV